MACLIILHNWFKIEIRGFIVALWVAIAQLVSIAKAISPPPDPNIPTNATFLVF